MAHGIFWKSSAMNSSSLIARERLEGNCHRRRIATLWPFTTNHHRPPRAHYPLSPKHGRFFGVHLSTVSSPSPLHELYGRWRYLLEHPGFRQAPVATLSRLLWRRLCSEFGIPAVVDLPAWDVRFYLPPKSHGAGTMMIYAVRELYEKELAHLPSFISPRMVVLDCGANYGIYSLAAARLVGPGGRVCSFVPGSESLASLG